MTKRIVYHVGDISQAGGMERIVVLKANWLAEHGYDVTILFAENNPDTYYPLSPQVKVACLNIFRGNVWDVRRNLWGALKSSYWTIKSHLDQRRKVTKYLRQHPCDVFITLMNRSFIPKLKDGSKKIHEIHFPYQSGMEFCKTNTTLYNFFFNIRGKRELRTQRKYDYFVVLTEKDKQQRGAFPNMVVIPNFISIKAPDITPDYQAKQIITIGKLGLQKGYSFLFFAWKMVIQKHPDWQLHIYGRSNDHAEFYNARRRELGLENSLFIHEAVPNIEDKYPDFSFYVMSSRYEGFPLCLLEAMACGLSCVSYDCSCGPGEIIRDGEDGILVRPVGDVRKLAEAIVHMIEHPELREQMGQKARQNVQRFQIDRVMQKWVDLIEA